MKKLLLALLFFIPSLAFAADNAVVLTPGLGVTMRTVDIGGGVQSPVNILGGPTGASIYGTAGTANAVVLTVQGISGGTVLPVSLTSTTITGTVAATQSGTWTVQPGNTANTTAWLVTGTGGTFPVTQAAASVASGAYSSGAFASGSFAAGSQVDLLTMRQTKNAGTAATNSFLVGGVYNSTPLTLADTQGASLQFDANGYLKVNTAAGAAAGGTSSNFGSAFPTPGTASGYTDGTNMVAARVGAITNATAATNFLNVNPACQYNATPLTVTDTRYQGIQCDVNGFLKVNVASATGLAQGSTTSGQTGSLIFGAVTTAAPSYTTAQSSPLSLSLSGDLRTVFSNSTIAVTNAGTFVAQAQPTPVTSGGLTMFFLQPAASDNHANIKNGAGQVYKLSVANNSATVNYLRLYNAGTGFNGCNSATNLVYQMAIPASTSGAGYSDSWDLGIAFATGISICVTSGYATTDTTNATASAMSVNIGYK